MSLTLESLHKRFDDKEVVTLNAREMREGAEIIVWDGSMLAGISGISKQDQEKAIEDIMFGRKETVFCGKPVRMELTA